MSVEITNANVVITVTGDLNKALTALEQAVSDETTHIVTRIQSGLDVTSRSFALYSPRYAKWRRAAGRVDLTYSGSMLNSIQTYTRRTPDGAKATISFSVPGRPPRLPGANRTDGFSRLATSR